MRGRRFRRWQAYSARGNFRPGNMGPKIESGLRFLRDGGKEVVITSYTNLCDAVQGSAGTHIVPDPISNDSANVRRREPALVR